MPGDKSALNPSGIRIGAPALTSRGLNEKDFDQVAEFLHRGNEITKEVQAAAASKKLVDFKAALKEKDWPAFNQLKNDVESFAASFPTIAFDESSMRYP